MLQLLTSLARGSRAIREEREEEGQKDKELINAMRNLETAAIN
jgi:hypothetical protein